MATSDAGDRITQPKSPGLAPPDSSLWGVWNTQTALEKGWKILLYGASGSGKTYMAGTFPDPIFLDLEDGMRTLLPLGRAVLRYPKDPSVSVTDFAQVKKFYNSVRALDPSKVPFKTVVVDSLNELQILMLKYALTLQSTSRLYEDQPTIGDYGKLARDMQSVVRQFYQLPYHIIFTAAAGDREYEDEKLYPQFVGKKSGPDLRRISEQVGYCYTYQKSKTDPPQHMVSFMDSPQYLAKDRSQKLTVPFTNTYQAMMSLVNSNNGKERSR